MTRAEAGWWFALLIAFALGLVGMKCSRISTELDAYRGRYHEIESRLRECDAACAGPTRWGEGPK